MNVSVRFPHPASAWWTVILLAIGWVPLFVADFVSPKNIGFGMAWGLDIALPCSFLAAVAIIVQAVRLMVYYANREPPESK